MHRRWHSRCIEGGHPERSGDVTMNLKNIVVAVDLHDHGGDQALALAFELAAPTGARVHLIHVLVVRGASNLSALPPAVVDDAAASAMESLKVMTVPYRT